MSSVYLRSVCIVKYDSPVRNGQVKRVEQAVSKVGQFGGFLMVEEINTRVDPLTYIQDFLKENSVFSNKKFLGRFLYLSVKED